MTIYVKTKKGMDEMLARRPGIDVALNSVLILIDGKRSVTQLNALIAKAKAPADSLTLLAEGGYIAPIAQPKLQAVATTTDGAAATQQESEAAHQRDQTTSAFMNVYSYMVNHTKQRLGLRGFGMQLKLERATTMDDLRTLIEPIGEAVARTQGLQAANEFIHSCKEKMDAEEVRLVSMRLVDDARSVAERRSHLRRVA